MAWCCRYYDKKVKLTYRITYERASVPCPTLFQSIDMSSTAFAAFDETSEIDEVAGASCGISMSNKQTKPDIGTDEAAGASCGISMSTNQTKSDIGTDEVAGASCGISMSTSQTKPNNGPKEQSSLPIYEDL